MKRGLFITFEGGEGAGKTTLIEKIARHLHEQGCSLVTTREPGGTKMGEEIRSLLLHKRPEPISPYTELSLFLASRAQHVFELIEPALAAKKVVLCDRFNDSSVAYQGAARGLGVERVEALCRLTTGLEPDLTFYLDIGPEIGLARAQRARAQDRIEAEALSFHCKIREAFLELCQKHKHRICLIDASQTPDKVYREALERLQALLHKTAHAK